MERKNREMTRQMEEIFRKHNSPEWQEKEKKRLKKEEENKNKETDLGLV